MARAPDVWPGPFPADNLERDERHLHGRRHIESPDTVTVGPTRSYCAVVSEYLRKYAAILTFSKHDAMMAEDFPEVQGGGSLILAWQVKDKKVLVVGGGEVRPIALALVSGARS